MDVRHITFLGAGNMTEAIVAGLLRAKQLDPQHIHAADPTSARRSALEERFGIHTHADNRAALKGADVAVIAVKPQVVPQLLAELVQDVPADVLWVSIAAGVPTSAFEAQLGPSARVIRVMPNTPSLLQQGAAAIAGGHAADDDDIATVEKLFSATGITAVVPETQLAAITALSGSGPAYVFLLAESMAAAGEQAGLPAAVAQQFAAETILGAARMMKETETLPSELRARVTSKGGTTAAALKVLGASDSAGLQQLVARAMGAAIRRAGELERDS